ncbi:SPW repeat protein [Dactylosporangium fulvum]|uniref:SPW repeat protein n=1 Tax=Dactylosporangium fulvum TaxID=53359 RepID=A0ABY5VMY6_9ACTN|nr:SPW repeat protein [Dactylosporangium fulvum]UWP78394.1 SPW repeat protein [Dactylosporangium fulvum]
MVRPISDLEAHPDIAELRARYDRAAETPTAFLADGALMLAGVWLAISPWVVGFAATQRNLAVNNLICGIAVSLLAIGFASAYGRTHGLAWVPVVLGIWAIISPWVVAGGGVTGGMLASNIVVGAITAALGLITMRLPGLGKSRPHRQLRETPAQR